MADELSEGSLRPRKPGYRVSYPLPRSPLPYRRVVNYGAGDSRIPCMSLVIPDDVVHATRMSVDDLRVEIAMLLFMDDKLTLGQAARFAGMSQPEFQTVLGQRRISLHYDVQDFRDDLETLDEIRSK